MKRIVVLAIVMVLAFGCVACTSEKAQLDKNLKGEWQLVAKTMKMYIREDAGLEYDYIENQIEYNIEKDEVRFRNRVAPDAEFNPWDDMPLYGEKVTVIYDNGKKHNYMYDSTDDTNYQNLYEYEIIDGSTLVEQLVEDRSERYGEIDTVKVTQYINFREDGKLEISATLEDEDLGQFEETKLLKKADYVFVYERVE